MNTRDIIALVGACLTALGPVLSRQPDGSTAWWIGIVLVTIGPILMASRAVTSVSQERKAIDKAKEEIQ